MSVDHRQYMDIALREASEVLGSTHPNPAVGAIIVHEGQVVATGRTQPAGGEHAEIRALKVFAETGIRATSSTRLYVTLEPCCTQGKTGPCTEAIINSGIKTAVVGTIDPNPLHAGKGLDILREAGISVECGVLAKQCESLNIIFNHWITTGRPLIAGKIATTLDGRIATRNGQSRWITGALAREDVHRWRRAFPAIAVGGGTVLSDNPSLTTRQKGSPDRCAQRFIFDRNLKSFQNETARVYVDEWKDRTIVISSKSLAAEAARLEKRLGIRFWLFDDLAGDEGLRQFRQRCADESLLGIYLEGGAHVLSAFLKAGLLDYLFAYRSPKLLGDPSGLSPFYGFGPDSMGNAIELSQVTHAVFGDDQLIRGFVKYPNGKGNL